MLNGSNCDRKSQLSKILTEPLNPRDLWIAMKSSTNFQDLSFKKELAKKKSTASTGCPTKHDSW